MPLRRVGDFRVAGLEAIEMKLHAVAQFELMIPASIDRKPRTYLHAQVIQRPSERRASPVPHRPSKTGVNALSQEPVEDGRERPFAGRGCVSGGDSRAN